jgi:xylulokinase
MSLLGIDIGTSGCKAAAFSEEGGLLAYAYQAYPTNRPQPGYSELDSHRVWNDVESVIRDVARRTQNDPITALSISSMGEAMVPVTRDRRILGASILSSDLRGSEYVQPLVDSFPPDDFYSLNGNLPATHFSLPKLLWLREHQPQLFADADYFLLWGSLAAFMLGGEPTAFNSLASRTLLLDLHRNDWSDPLLQWAKLDRARLGTVVSGGTIIGKVSPPAAERLGLPPDVSIVAGGHDQCCNALGSGAIRSGEAVCGIGSFECLTPVYPMPANPLVMKNAGLNIEHHVLPELYVSFLFNQAGTLIKWFADTFAAADQAPAGSDIYELLNRELPPEPTRLLVLPYFDPTAWPRVIDDAGGVILGLKTHTTRGEILKAFMEAITYYFVEGIGLLRDQGIDLHHITATGGGSRSDRWLQIKADILGIPVMRPGFTESGVCGAAMLAGLATGVFASAEQAVSAIVKIDRSFEPQSTRHAFYRERYALYRELLPATHPLLRKL